MGIEPFLLVVARCGCSRPSGWSAGSAPAARSPTRSTQSSPSNIGLTAGETFYRPKGCLQCRRLGYRGRVGVFEVIRITPRLTQLIQKRAPLDQLRKAAREEGMKMLFDSALDKVRQGLTSLEAAMSVTTCEPKATNGVRGAASRW